MNGCARPIAAALVHRSDIAVSAGRFFGDDLTRTAIA